jgi:hypothetical protein
MGRRNFHGKVETLADACEADYLIVVKCERCETRKQMHPYNLLSGHNRLATARFDTELAGFFCITCQSHVSVTITCTHMRPGTLG